MASEKLFENVDRQRTDGHWRHWYTNTGPLADSHEIKGFYKSYFRQNKGCFIEILTKIKSKLTSNLLVFYRTPIFKSMSMIDDGMKVMQQILSQ